MAAINSEDLVLSFDNHREKRPVSNDAGIPGPACTSVVRVFVESDKSFVRLFAFPTASESFQTCTSSSPVFGRDTSHSLSLLLHWFRSLTVSTIHKLTSKP